MLSISQVAPASLFCSFTVLSDLISNTAHYVVNSMIQTGLLAAKFLQPVAVLLSLLSIQSSVSPTAKIPLAPAISTFAFEYFYWLTVFWTKYKFLSAFPASVCILFTVYVLTVQHPLASLRSSSIYNFLHIFPYSQRDALIIRWAVLWTLKASAFTLLWTCPEELVISL